nr:unnamed protein product [Haemonchus contortus]
MFKKSAESPEKEPVKQIPIVRSSREERPSAPRAASAVPTKQAVPSKPVVQPTRQSTLRQLPIEAQKKQMSPTAPVQPSKQSRMDDDEVDVEIPQQSSRRSAGRVSSLQVTSPATESEAPKKQKSQAALTQSSKQSQVDDDEVQVDVEIPQQSRSSRRSAGHLSSLVTESDEFFIRCSNVCLICYETVKDNVFGVGLPRLRGRAMTWGGQLVYKMLKYRAMTAQRKTGTIAKGTLIIPLKNRKDVR